MPGPWGNNKHQVSATDLVFNIHNSAYDVNGCGCNGCTAGKCEKHLNYLDVDQRLVLRIWRSFPRWWVAGGSLIMAQPGYGVVVEPQLKRRALQQLLTSPRRAVTKVWPWVAEKFSAYCLCRREQWKLGVSWAKVLVESFVEEPSRLCAVVRETRRVSGKSFSWAKFLSKVLLKSRVGFVQSFGRPEESVERVFRGQSSCRKFC